MRHTDVQAGFQSRTRECIVSFLEFIERVCGQLERGEMASLQTWAEQFLAEIGYMEDLRRSEKNPETAGNRAQNLKDLVASLETRTTVTDKPVERLQVFLEDLMLDSDREEEKELDANAVTLITMHSCKGLEFPYVYVVGLEDGL